jgi:taurine dioxygenase
MLSNLDKDGNPSGKHPDKGTLYWHTDGSWRERTGQATMMYSEIVPPVGGETEFADMYAAYDNLSVALKKKIEGKRAIHNLDFSRTRRHGEDPMTAEQKAKVPPIAHPIVRTHPETGRKALYVNGGHTLRFKDMSVEESAPLLSYLYQHMVRPEFTCRFRWEPGSIALWDNRCTQHNPVNDYHGHRRVMHRVTLAGDVPR